MRARRRFQPNVDLMPLRLAPSSAGVVYPMDPVAGAGGNSSPPIISPMDPVSGPGSSPSVNNPPTAALGSFTPTVTTTVSC